MHKHFIHLVRAATVALMPLLVAACGGGAGGSGTAAPPTASGTTVVAGTVTGFGSVVIDGVEYAEGNVSVARDVDPRAETAVTMAGVKVGQQVEGKLDASGKLAKVLVRANVIGPVESIDVPGASFKAVGQTIKVVTSGEGKTIFEGAGGLGDLAVGNWVEVHGTLDADGKVVASRVEVQSSAGEIKVRASGIVKDVSDTAKSFKLGGLTINFGTASILPEGAKIENDALVFVFSDQLPVGGTLTAKSIRVARQPALEGRRLVVGGLVTGFNSISDFKVRGLKVDASGAEIKGSGNPTAADIKDMTLVRVEGTLDGTGSSVVLKATRVWIVPASEERRITLLGQVTDFVSAASFAVRGTPVDATGAKFEKGSASDLKDGAFVLVKGRIDGTVVKADEVIFNVPPKDVVFRLIGTVSNYESTAKTFKLLGIPMKLGDGARFEGGAPTDFGNGKVVEVKGSFDGTAFVVTTVVFKSGEGATMIRAEGVISGVSATGFTLNGATFKLTPQTVIESGPLADGKHVEVKAQMVGADVVALEVEVQAPSATARLMGPITDFVSKTDFKVQGQKVDAGTATFVGGTETDLGNGKLVRVEGALDAGVVKATAVKFLR